MMKKVMLVAVLSYFIGTVNLSYLLAKWIKDMDIRTVGSRNAGTSNAVMMLGWKWGVLAGVTDILKGFLAVHMTRYLLPEDPVLLYVAALFVILGHVFPFYMGFKGGKGLATLLGTSMSIGHLTFPIVFLTLLAVSFLTDYLVIGTAGSAIAFAVDAFIKFGTSVCLGISIAIAVLMISKHIPNYKRIASGGGGEVPLSFFLKHKGLRPDDVESFEDFIEYRTQETGESK